MSCGGEVISHGDSNIISTICPFCGSTILNEKVLASDYNPDYIIPFKVTKNQAMNLYKKQCAGKCLVPDDFLSQSKIESIQGLYVPFWLYDYDVYGEADVQVKINGTRKLDHYLIHTSLSDIPVDGSSWIENELMESVEPFHFSEIETYSPYYLLGFYSEKYDVNCTESEKDAKERAINTCKHKFQTRFATIERLVVNDSKLKSKKMALAPVWIISTRYRDNIHQFVINGQSGVHAGNLPRDARKKNLLFLKFMIGLSTLGICLSILYF